LPQKAKLPQKIKDLLKKWAKELNQTFSKEEVQMAKKHIKNSHHPWP
jgi:16S rRNA G527 N7-methylase RsmG